MWLSGPDELRALLERQCGVVSRQQAVAAGLAPTVIDNRLRSDRWQRLQQGVYATFTGAPSREALLWSGLLRAGSTAALSHQFDGLAAHPPEQRWADSHRDNELAGAGIVTLHYNWHDVNDLSCGVAAEVAGLLLTRGTAVTLRSCGPGCLAVRDGEAVPAFHPEP